jgi:hypothetical protein
MLSPLNRNAETFDPIFGGLEAGGFQHIERMGSGGLGFGDDVGDALLAKACDFGNFALRDTARVQIEDGEPFVNGGMFAEAFGRGAFGFGGLVAFYRLHSRILTQCKFFFIGGVFPY